MRSGKRSYFPSGAWTRSISARSTPNPMMRMAPTYPTGQARGTKYALPRAALLNGHALGQVAGHVDIVSELLSHVIGEQLERNDRQDRTEEGGGARYPQHVGAVRPAPGATPG